MDRSGLFFAFLLARGRGRDCEEPPTMSATVVRSSILAAASRTSKKHAIERAMVGIGNHEVPELIRIPKGREWAVNQANDLAEFDLLGRAPQPIAALRAPNAFHDARVLEFQQNQLKKFLRQIAINGNVPDLDGLSSVSAAKSCYRLQCVKPFLGDFQAAILSSRSLAILCYRATHPSSAPSVLDVL